MPSRKCLWDNSHTFEADEDDTYRQLCRECYHNIYVDVFKKAIPWGSFVDDIENIKRAYKYVAVLDTYYKNNIMKFAASKPDTEELKMTCLICGESYSVKQNDSYRYLCPSCVMKCYFPLKQSRSSKEIKELILNLKKVIKSTDQLIDRLIEIANES